MLNNFCFFKIMPQVKFFSSSGSYNNLSWKIINLKHSSFFFPQFFHSCIVICSLVSNTTHKAVHLHVTRSWALVIPVIPSSVCSAQTDQLSKLLSCHNLVSSSGRLLTIWAKMFCTNYFYFLLSSDLFCSKGKFTFFTCWAICMSESMFLVHAWLFRQLFFNYWDWLHFIRDTVVFQNQYVTVKLCCQM